MHRVISCFYEEKLSSAEASIESNSMNFEEFNNYTFLNVPTERVVDSIMISRAAKVYLI